MISRLNAIVDRIRSALPLATSTWYGKAGLGVIFFATVSIIVLLNPKRAPEEKDVARVARLANGWVTNCAGPAFSGISGVGKSGPGPDRPMFKVNDQLVLAIPAKNQPSAGNFENEPHECTQIGDLPSVPYLYFVIRGNWSAGYKPEDVPLDGGRKQFLPDAVTVRIERDTFVTSPMEDQDRIARLKKFNDDLLDRQEIGGLTCGRIVRAPHAGKRGALFCSGHRTSSDADTIKFRTSANENTTPFVWIDAEYRSTLYGGIHVYWQVWTLDLAHAIDIDEAIWRSLAEWNLLDRAELQAARQ